MSNDKDFLDQLGAKAKTQLNNSVSPYRTTKEPTHSVQVRDSLYKKLKYMALEQDTTILEIVDGMIRRDMKQSKSKDKQPDK